MYIITLFFKGLWHVFCFLAFCIFCVGIGIIRLNEWYDDVREPMRFTLAVMVILGILLFLPSVWAIIVMATLSLARMIR